MNGLPAACDYLVIGSGAAGAVVAARLSEDPDVRVVLLEAGGKDDSLLFKLPGLEFAVGAHPRSNWGFMTEPVPGLDNRALVYLQGRVLGGSSSINGMIYTRGHSREYDIWRQMGCEGWAAEDVLPYFKKSEGNVRGEGQWHGGSGPLKVRPAKPDIPICDAFLEAADAAGFPVLDDLNRDTVDGFGYYDINVEHGRRMSTARSYLEPVRGRNNLAVISQALALRLIIEKGRAKGAELLVRGEPTSIMVDGEIIVSGGAVKSPQLLMLSGIGPAEPLRQLDIPVHHDAPKVGQGLQNHVCYRPQYICNAPVSASRDLTPLGAVKASLQYAFQRKGPLAESYAPAGGFFRTDSALETPDAQVVLLSALAPTNAGGSRFRLGDLLPKEHGFGLTIYQGSPHSRGTVSLRAADPLVFPKIDPGYFTDPRDMQVLLKAVNRMREMMKYPAIARYIEREMMPGESVQDDDALEADIRCNGATAYHQCGSCAMGPDPDAVLDPQLRVRGIDGLRVADTSIMPRIPNAALHAPTIMIGEKAAAMIRGH
ncbi:MAG: glucose-methanol-choline oxidoreductase [Alphaproteobacteria bacterium]|nr:glucose-methanol-choline oxidoreductase [Alphaproteobacteria bacterium]